MGFKDKFKNLFKTNEDGDFESQKNNAYIDESGENNDHAHEEPIPDDSRNFRFLDNLIHSGDEEIILDSDITLDDVEVSEYLNGIPLDVNNLVINANGFTIDARGKARIFMCNAKNITIKYARLNNGFAQDIGAAILNSGELTLSDSTLSGNTCEGSAIYNSGKLTVTQSVIEKSAGVCNNGELAINESILRENTVEDGRILENDNGILKITDCLILDNMSPDCIIGNESHMQIYNTKFKGNECEHVLYNHGDESNSSIQKCRFMENHAGESIILNNGNYLLIENAIFEDNTSKNIHNLSDLILVNPEIKGDGRSILNEGYIFLKNPLHDYSNEIYGEGTVDDSIPVEYGNFNFEYLDTLICQCRDKKIVLEHDINLEIYEIDFYASGILLDIDGLTIDGNGHTIDARRLSQIFHISGSNITLENFLFKNGRQKSGFDDTSDGGGAISINDNASVTLRNCTFENNRCENTGGAILNCGTLKSEHNIFMNNSSRSFGGAVFNEGVFETSHDEFRLNEAQMGSAIYNRMDMFIDEGICISDNIPVSEPAICNLGSLKANFELDGECILDDGQGESHFNVDNLKVENDDFNNQENEYHETDDVRNEDYDYNIQDDELTGNFNEEEIKQQFSFNKHSSKQFPQSQWKYVHLFISSTFNDMHAERDYLIKDVFPELRQWCEDHKIYLIDVDLRWGVREEDTRKKQTIEKCLRHIDESRPFFICFLGQRRGWVPNFPQDISDTTKKTYPKIDSYEGKSATEMEIEHALINPLNVFLNNENKISPSAKRCLFFFRNDSYLEHLSDAQRRIYANDDAGDSENIEYADFKLNEIKQIIRAKKMIEDEKSDDDDSKIHITVNEYSGEWNEDLTVPELNPCKDRKTGEVYFGEHENQGRLTNFRCGYASLKEVLIEQLKYEIAMEFPENMEIESETDSERFMDQQELISYANDKAYINYDSRYLKSLENYVENENVGRLFLIRAKAGFQGTSLLARFASTYHDRNPDLKIYKRFATSDLEFFPIWKSIMDEAGIGDDEDFNPPADKYGLQVQFMEILKRIACRGDTLFIFDSLDAIGGINVMYILMHHDDFPKNIKFIISTDRDDVYCDLELENMTEEDKLKYIDEYLGNYLKSLDSEQIENICINRQTDNPLFLTMLLSRLRLFGSFCHLNDEIEKFKNYTLQSLTKSYFEDIENEEEMLYQTNITPLVFSLLSYAHKGLSEEDLISIIQDHTNLDKCSITDAIRLSVIRLREFLVRLNGRYLFLYYIFSDVSQELFVEDKVMVNELLAGHYMLKADRYADRSFKPIGDTKKEKLMMFEELMHYLNESESYDELAEILSSYAFIKNKLELSNIGDLISDYQFGIAHPLNQIEDSPLPLIRRTLELSTPVLEENTEQLPEQLWGRLIGMDDENIERMMMEIDSNISRKWMKSKSKALYSPKSSVIKKIRPYGNKSTTAISMLNDKEIIFASEDGMLSIFNLETEKIDILDNETSKVIRIIPDDGTVIVGYENGKIKRWGNTGLVENYPTIEAELTDICISKTYNKIYASSYNGTFSIDLETKLLILEDIEPKMFNQISVEDSYSLLHLIDDREIETYKLPEMEKVKSTHLQSHYDDEMPTVIDTRKEIKFMELNKRFAISISQNGHMKFWNMLKNIGAGENIDETHVCGSYDELAHAKILEDENKIVTISKLGIMRIWNLPQPRNPKFSLEFNEMTGMVTDIQTGIISPTTIEYFTDDRRRWLIVGNERNDVSIIDLNKKIEEETHIKHAESVLSIDTDGNHMITSSEDGEIFTWDLDSEQVIKRYANDFRFTSVSFNHEDSRLAMAGVKYDKDGRITNRLATYDFGADDWQDASSEYCPFSEMEVEVKLTSEEIRDIGHYSSGIAFIERQRLFIGCDEIELDEYATALSTSPDCSDVFVGFDNGSIVKYPDGTYFNNNEGMSVTKIKHAGDRLIAGYYDGLIDIFALDGTLLTTLYGHKSTITDIEIIDNGRIASVSKDFTIRFWDTETGECTYTYFLDIYPTAIKVIENKVVIGDTLGNVAFFEF